MKSSSFSSSTSSGRRHPTRFSPLEISLPSSLFCSASPLPSPIDEAYSSLFTTEADFIARRNLRNASDMSAGTGLKRIWNGKKVVWLKDVDSLPPRPLNACTLGNNTPPPTPLFRQPLADVTTLNGRILPPPSLCFPTTNPRGLIILTTNGDEGVGEGAPSPVWSIWSGSSLMEGLESGEYMEELIRRRERGEG